jgi:hypothetical protein
MLRLLGVVLLVAALGCGGETIDAGVWMEVEAKVSRDQTAARPCGLLRHDHAHIAHAQILDRDRSVAAIRGDVELHG